MKSKNHPTLLRVLDANLNRAREGVRVCEEAARMVLNDSTLTRQCQRFRYALTRSAQGIPAFHRLKARDSKRDVGRPALRGSGRPHRDCADLVTANLRRVQEALRVLEEFSRILPGPSCRVFSRLRFRSYSLEQAFFSKLPALRHR